MINDRKIKTPITPACSVCDLVGQIPRSTVRRRISQPKLLSLREEETKGRKRGGEAEIVVGGKVPESVECVLAYVCQL